MAIPLHLLLLEDMPDDAELTLRELQRSGFSCNWTRVDTEASYAAALDPALDLILADYSLPGFDALRALELLQERGYDIPFIIVSGAIGEDVAVQAMRQGAADYLLKDRLGRLGQAVTQAVAQKHLRDERGRASQVLQESEERFRSLVQNVSDLIAILEPDGTIRYGSPSCEQVLGYRPEDLVGLDATTLMHPDDLLRLTAIVEAGMSASGMFGPIEARVRHRAGDWRYLELIANNRSSDGNINGIILTARDITERRRAEDALREAEARYRGIVENALEGIFQTGFDDSFQAVNPAMARMLGYDTAEDLMAEAGTLRQLYVDLDRRDDFARLMDADGTVTDFEFRARCRDGSETWVSMNASAVLDSAGRVIGVEGMLADIKERRRSQQALEQSSRENLAQKTELEGILTHLSDGLMLAGNDGRVTMINPAAREVLGLTLDGAGAAAQQGRQESAYWNAIGADGAPLSAAELPLARALAGERGPARDIELLVGSERRLISASAAPLVTPEGQPHGAVAVLRDVSDVRRAQERVVEAERLRALGEMASGVAHDFNNLLAVIMGRTELLLSLAMKMENGTTIEPHLNVVRQASLDGAETVKRLQTFSGVAQPTSGQAMDLPGIINDVVEFSRPRWKATEEQRGVTIDVETYADPLPPLAGSPAELREVLVNLMFNAVDAMPAGGTIRIAAARRGDYVLLTVQDTGDGMPEAVRRRIFEPFFTTKGTRGAGLGLSMSYGIITRMGGAIDVASSPGQGTTFSITLPFHPVDLVQEEDIEVSNDVMDILLVDDQPQVLDTASLMLELDGHFVVSAGSGPEALERMEEREAAGDPPFDVVLTDLGMPGMNGLQLVAAIRASGSTVPCVLVTGWGMELADDDVAAIGAQAVLPKPYSSDQLREVLRAVRAMWLVAGQ